MIVWSVWGTMTVVLLVIASALFYARPPQQSELQLGTDILIDFALLDSDAVKNLEPFYHTGVVFSYTAKDKNGREVKGNITAVTQDEAKILLVGQGFVSPTVQAVPVGRNQPFSLYYQPKIVTQPPQ